MSQFSILKQMSRQVSCGSAGDYHAAEQAGVARLSCRLSTDEQAGNEQLPWQLSARRAGSCCGAQLAYIKQMSRQVSRGSAVDYEADEQAGVTRLSWSQSSRRAGRCRAAQLAYIKQMSGQVSRGSAGEDQADEQAGVARLSWRVSGR